MSVGIAECGVGSIVLTAVLFQSSIVSIAKSSNLRLHRCAGQYIRH